MLNKVILQGRLTETPELKVTNSGKYVTTFSLAVERDFSTGNEKETDFINIVAWNNNAEFTSKYFTKGNGTTLLLDDHLFIATTNDGSSGEDNKECFFHNNMLLLARGWLCPTPRNVVLVTIRGTTPLWPNMYVIVL